MHRLYIWMEVIVILPFWLAIRKFIDIMQLCASTADWYSAHKIHFWQARKALIKYNEEYNEMILKKLMDSIDTKDFKPPTDI